MRQQRDESDLMTLYGRLTVIAIPYLWMLLLFLLPFLIVFRISFSEIASAVPPYTDLFSYDDGLLNIVLNFGNYVNLITDTIYLDSYLQSLKIAAISTILCILIGYPLAWAISQCKPSTRNILLLLIILPSWTSFLIRVYAWIGILNPNGLLNHFLMWLGVIDQPLIIMKTYFAVYIGIVYSYLPFVILPIYTSLSKVDTTLIEAALDLGCKPIKTFFKIIVPLTKNGVIAGGMLVFIPAVGEYVIPELLGPSEGIMIGTQLWTEFFNNHDWPAASAVASVMLLILIVPIYYFNKFQNSQTGGK
ncbi:putrescine ABC transporter permease PotH [Gilliamella sp. B2923]|nr:putrescine ABC transporter permease PotH [Gilliamella sp. B3722]MCX8609062.1 putrescine ABC transporter permease PotH [Gilliamella sp. B3771]MCX8610033.1 putrescine ABC transporter permease PotH [Gilliamella sp. B3891]MCX8612707.1 putrescine ABC transporter permease PotH [Gilliamella sp. B3773]MCX8616646.1 putrescine ABC transporter permease PotH [Gilliamella sp. B3770]MCX8617707.1 putrescine ABC transporter permease PotH [Gilliamella sp. B2923]MCX8619740.1 putrescine ABC transporter perme